MNSEKLKGLFFEIIRFGLVGAFAFVCDWGTLMLILYGIFGGVATYTSIAISTGVGFLVGVTVNYILSVLFVFKVAKTGVGRSKKSMLLFLVIAIIGFILTQLIMNLGTVTLGYNETLVKVVATTIVMIWNYLSRKFLVFRG